MPNWIFYPPLAALKSATFTATTGTSSSLANTVDTRRFSRMDVDTIGTYVSGADEFMYRIDLGSQKTANFMAIVSHNLWQETADIRLYVDGTDNSGLISPQQSIGARTSVSTDEPIWVEHTTADYTKRYWWPFLDSIAATAYAGELFIGARVTPTSDPNWAQPIEFDIESGRIVNTSLSGTNFKTRMHGTRRGWQLMYEFISTTNKDLLVNGLFDDTVVDTPFVFTSDGGTSFYYGEITGNPIVTPVQAGLWNVDFRIVEVIA